MNGRHLQTQTSPNNHNSQTYTLTGRSTKLYYGVMEGSEYAGMYGSRNIRWGAHDLVQVLEYTKIESLALFIQILCYARNFSIFLQGLNPQVSMRNCSIFKWAIFLSPRLVFYMHIILHVEKVLAAWAQDWGEKERKGERRAKDLAGPHLEFGLL